MKWCNPQPRLWPGDGKLYVCALRWPSDGLFRGIPFSKGLACDGRPITSDMIEMVRGAGQQVLWWEFEEGIRVQWFEEGPRACVEGAEPEVKPEPEPEPEPKRRGRPKKNGNG